MKDRLRCWSCMFQYEGKKPALFSHVVLDIDADKKDVEDKLHEVMRFHLPEGFTIVELLKGRAFFDPWSS